MINWPEMGTHVVSKLESILQRCLTDYFSQIEWKNCLEAIQKLKYPLFNLLYDPSYGILIVLGLAKKVKTLSLYSTIWT